MLVVFLVAVVVLVLLLASSPCSLLVGGNETITATDDHAYGCGITFVAVVMVLVVQLEPLLGNKKNEITQRSGLRKKSGSSQHVTSIVLPPRSTCCYHTVPPLFLLVLEGSLLYSMGSILRRW